MTPYSAIWAWLKANLFRLGVFWLIFWVCRVPLWAQMCGMVHPFTDKEDTWRRHSLQDIRLGWPLTIQFEHGQRWIWLVHISSCFLCLRGAPMGPNVWSSPLGHQKGRWTWCRYSMGNFRLFEHGQRQILLVWVYLGSYLGPVEGPYGPECVVQYTWTPTKKADLM